MRWTRCFIIPVSALLIASCSDGRSEDRQYPSLNDTTQILQPEAEEPVAEREPVDTDQLVGGKEPLHRFNPKCKVTAVAKTSIQTEVEFTNALDMSNTFYVDVDVFYGNEKKADFTYESEFISVGKNEWDRTFRDVSGISNQNRAFWNCEITALRPKSLSIVEIPRLTGVSEERAKDTLTGLGLVVVTTEVESDQPQGTVVLQAPRAGEEVQPGEKVEIFIAIPQTHKLTVIYQIAKGLYEDIGNDECEYPDGGAAAGQKVSLVGPNSESLGTVVIERGIIPSESDDNQLNSTDCYLLFEFDNVKEVSSYTIALDGNTNFGAVPLNQVQADDWTMLWRATSSSETESTSVATSTIPPTSQTPSTTTPPATVTTQPSTSETVSQANARAKAASYLRYSNFSRSGLINQLEYEGYSTEDATYGVDAQNADWFAQAVGEAASYLQYSSFSRSGLINQLEYEGFSEAEAIHGVDAQNADWFAQAVGEAASYLQYSSFSRSGLINQLEYEGFSEAEAIHGVDAQNADWFAQAALEAQSYLDYSSFSRQELISQLLYEGFSQAEAEYGVNAVGL